MSSFSDDYDDGCAECHDTGALCANGFCEVCHGMQSGEPFDGEHDGDNDDAAPANATTPELIVPLSAALEPPCLHCGAPMLLGYAPAELFKYRSPYAYLCSNRPTCRAFASALPDGTLAGVPANAATRKLRPPTTCIASGSWARRQARSSSDASGLASTSFCSASWG
jgi:hypothetical protein